MRYLQRPAGQTAVVAVVGGGASGTLAATYMLREAAAAGLPLRIILIDRYGWHGLGQAYATEHPCHLLNAPAARMSALTDEPADLTRWAMANGIQHDGFLPRAVYGWYLNDVLASAERAAWPRATVSRLTADVVGLNQASLHDRLLLQLADRGVIDADAVVLATGNRPPALPGCPIPATARYVADPWAPGALEQVTDGGSVAVIGTGLTMLDVAITVTEASPHAVVHAVSRHGLLPHPHPATHATAATQATAATPASKATRPGCATQAAKASQAAAAATKVTHAISGPASLPELFTDEPRLPALIRAVRMAAASEPTGWEAVVDSLRQYVPALWQGMSPIDRRMFLQHVARFWEVHRHRMPPATARRIASLTTTGRLSVLTGSVVAVTEQRTGLRITIDSHGRRTTLDAGWLVNATGPAADIGTTADPLLRQLLRSGLAVTDPLQLGITADADGAMLGSSGMANNRLFTVGPPLRGQLYETTAIPEIREQAARLAKRLVAASTARVAADSAGAAADSAA